MDDARCRCGHPRSAHRHYRGGTECALCLDCLRFRSAGGRIRQLAAILARRSRQLAAILLRRSPA
ncbi:MAG: hypothetical protein ABSA02_27910 [Trebonia sp.]